MIFAPIKFNYHSMPIISGSFPQNGNSGATARKEEKAIEEVYMTWDA